MKSILRLLSALAEFLLIRARRKPLAEAKEAVADARAAVAMHDEEKVNQMLEDARLGQSLSENDKRHAEGFASPSTVLLGLVVSLFVLAAVSTGCIRTKTLVIPDDRRVVAMEIDGRQGWFVPDAIMADLVEVYVREGRREELRNLEK